MPGLVAPASVKRQTDPEWRSGECEVHPSLELLTCIPFSQALKGTSDEESSRLSDPEMSSLSRMQTKRMLISAFPNCRGKEEEKKTGVFHLSQRNHSHAIFEGEFKVRIHL